MSVGALVNYAPAYRWSRKPINAPSIQVARLLLNRAKYALSPSYRTLADFENYNALDRDGIVMIHDFLPAADFAAVMDEYRAVQSGAARHPRVVAHSNHGLSNWSAVFTPLDPAFRRTNSAVRNHPVIRDLVSHVLRRRVDYFPPTISVLVQHLAEGATEKTNTNSYLHADVHYHTVKAVLYLNDVTEGGAPFVYCYGAHRLTGKRIALEYELSRRCAKPKPGELMNGQPILGPDLIERYGLDPRPVYAPANTLIIADHAGQHAMGPLAPGRERATLRISFRFADSLRYRLRAVLNPIRPPYPGFDPPPRLGH